MVDNQENMSQQIVTVLCYWGGVMKDGTEGINYVGSSPRVLKLNSDIRLNELKEKLFGITGWDERENDLEIIGRYLVEVNPNRYIPLSIVDEASIEVMFDMIRVPNSRLNCIQLYLERKAIPGVHVAPIRVSRPRSQHSIESTQHVVHETSIRVKRPRSQHRTESTQHVEMGSTSKHNVNDVGPNTLSVLRLQREHRSEDIWDGQGTEPLACRHHILWPLHNEIRPLVHAAGFYYICQIGHIPMDHALLTALVERWRQETHTFHFPVGEMTVTLQDVALLLGLQIDGLPVSGATAYDWHEQCEQLLGLRPDGRSIIGSSLKLTWLSHNFSQLPEVLGEHTRAYYTRAYILHILGSILFTDCSGDTVPLMFLPLLANLEGVAQYSWGSATLAHLYRSLCRASRRGTTQLGGNLLLLQLWAWERLHIGRPQIHTVGEGQLPDPDVGQGAGVEIIAPLGVRWSSTRRHHRTFQQNPIHVLIFYRDQLDQQQDSQVMWQPYTDDRLARVPPVCLHGRHIWRARVPLICFAYVEWHFPDRVLRQFGMLQHIPDAADTSDHLHSIDRRGRQGKNWWDFHAEFHYLWEERADHLVNQPAQDPSDLEHYIRWYHSITRRRISPPIDPMPAHPRMEYQPSGSATNRLVEALVTDIREATNAMRGAIDDATRVVLTRIAETSKSALEDVGEGARLQRALQDLEPEPPVGGRGCKHGRSRSRSRTRTRGRGRGR